MLDEADDRRRYTNNELAILIRGLEATMAAGFAELRQGMAGAVLKAVYDADQQTRRDASQALSDKVDAARALSLWCIGLCVTLIAAMASLLAVQVTR